MRIVYSKSWNWWKVTKLLFAVVCLIGGIYSADGILIFASIFLVAHSFFSRCAICDDNSCATNSISKP